MRGQPKTTPKPKVRIQYDYRGERRWTEPMNPHEARSIYIRLMGQDRNPIIRKEEDEGTN